MQELVLLEKLYANLKHNFKISLNIAKARHLQIF
jgi:hypothetical protein